LCDFVSDWYATPRKSEYHLVVSAGFVLLLTSEYGSGVSAIGKP
jgi:hypothetical protein